MVNKKVVYKGPRGLALIAGLDWQLLPAGKSVNDAVREKAKIKGATHFVTVRAAQSEEVQIGKRVRDVKRVTAGLVQTLGGADGFGKNPHSVAAAFAIMTAEHDKAALFAVMPDERVAIVVVINGMPVLDAIVSDRLEARSRLASFLSQHADMSIFANDEEQYPQDHYDGIWESLSNSVTGASAIKAVPINVLQIILMLAVTGVAIVGWQYWEAEKKRKAQEALVAEAARTNPETLYLKALSKVQGFGLDRAAVLHAFKSLSPMPYTTNGWRTIEASCAEVTYQTCRLNLERTHGTFEMLMDGIKNLPLSVIPSTTEISLTKVSLGWDAGLKPLTVLPDSVKQITVDTFLSKDGSQFQEWMLAGLSLRINPPSTYPTVPGVPPNFSHPSLIRRGGFEVTGIALPLVPEVITSAPENVVFTGYKVNFSTGGDDALTKSKATITGYYYVNK